MPEITQQYYLTHRELAQALMKQIGVYEGKWMLLMEFNFTAGNFNIDPNTVYPGSIALVTRTGLQKANADSPPSLVFDAAELNPK